MLARVSGEVGLLRSRAEQTARAGVWPAALIAIVAASAALLTVALFAAMPLAVLVGFYVMARRAMAQRPVIARGALASRDGAIFLGERRLCARDAVRSGAVVPGESEGTLVRLERRSGVPIDLVMPDVETARAALASLGLDPTRAVGRFHVLAPDVQTFRTRLVMVIVAILASLAVSLIAAAANAPLFIPLVLLPTLAGALSMMVPAKTTVGTDGITICRFGKELFLPLEGVARAVAADGETVMGSPTRVVRLLGADGELHHELLVDQKRDDGFADGMDRAVDARARALAERINETLRLRVSGASFDRATLARGDRDAAEWVRELRGLLGRTASFRDAGPPTEEALLEIVEDGAAPAAHRAAAAIALTGGGPEARARVRVASDTTAAPKLRVALEAALDEHDDEALAEALRRLER